MIQPATGEETLRNKREVKCIQLPRLRHCPAPTEALRARNLPNRQEHVSAISIPLTLFLAPTTLGTLDRGDITPGIIHVLLFSDYLKR
jgi:hypothetical protein